MSKHVRSRSVWEVVLRDEESSEPVGPVLGLLPSDEQPPQGEAPSQSQEITPGQDNEDERAPEVQDPDPEADLQELALAKTGREGKVKGESSPNTQPFQMPAAGPDPETDLQDLAQLNTGDEGSDGPDVMEDILPKPESIYMPEAGPDPEDDLRELAQPKTDREGGDGPDLTQELVSKLETVHMPEAGQNGDTLVPHLSNHTLAKMAQRNVFPFLQQRENTNVVLDVLFTSVKQ